MSGQSPYIINAFLIYENDSIGLNANFGFNIEGKKLAIVNSSGIPDIYEQPVPQLDFSLLKKFGENINIKFGIKNILDAKEQQTYSYSGKNYYYSDYMNGRSFSLGITYLIK